MEFRKISTESLVFSRLFLASLFFQCTPKEKRVKGPKRRTTRCGGWGESERSKSIEELSPSLAPTLSSLEFCVGLQLSRYSTRAFMINDRIKEKPVHSLASIYKGGGSAMGTLTHHLCVTRGLESMNLFIKGLRLSLVLLLAPGEFLQANVCLLPLKSWHRDF